MPTGPGAVHDDKRGHAHTSASAGIVRLPPRPARPLPARRRLPGRRAQTISVADASSDTIRTVILPISSTAPRDASTPPTVGYAAGPQWRRPHGWSQGGIDGRRQRTDLHRREVPECAPWARGRGGAVLADQVQWDGNLFGVGLWGRPLGCG